MSTYDAVTRNSFSLTETLARNLWQSAHAWLLVVALLFFGAHGNFSFLNSGGGGGGMGVLGYVVLPGIAYGIVAYQIVVNGRGVLRLAQQNILLTILALFTIASVVFSQDPVRALYSGLLYLVITLFAYYLVLHFTTEELMELFTMTGTAAMALGLLTIALFPQYGRSHLVRTEGAWEGIFLDRTSSARIMVFLLSAAVVPGAVKFKPLRIVYLGLMLLFIVRGMAATAIIVLGAYMAFVYGIAGIRRLGRRSGVIVSLIGGPLLIGSVVAALPLLGDFVGLFGRDLTLTGRTVIWQSLWLSIMKRPLMGYGFSAFWNGLHGESANAQVAAHWVFGYAHNGVLEILVQLGFTGLLLVIAALLQAAGNGWYGLRNYYSPGVLWLVGLLALTVFYNIDEATLVLPSELLSIVFIVACCSLNTLARKHRHQGLEAMPYAADLPLAS